MRKRSRDKSGQALTEVLTYTGLLAIAAIVVISLYGKQIQSGMAAITGGMAGKDAEVVSYAEEATSAASMDADTGNYSPYSDGGSGYMKEDSGYTAFQEQSQSSELEDKSNPIPNHSPIINVAPVGDLASTPVRVFVTDDGRGEIQYRLEKENDDGSITEEIAFVDNSAKLPVDSTNFRSWDTAKKISLNWGVGLLQFTNAASTLITGAASITSSYATNPITIGNTVVGYFNTINSASKQISAGFKNISNPLGSTSFAEDFESPVDSYLDNNPTVAKVNNTIQAIGFISGMQNLFSGKANTVLIEQIPYGDDKWALGSQIIAASKISKLTNLVLPSKMNQFLRTSNEFGSEIVEVFGNNRPVLLQ